MTPGISVTDAAAERLHANWPSVSYGFRISTWFLPGLFYDHKRIGDRVITTRGLEIILDQKTFSHIEGKTLDYSSQKGYFLR